MTKSRDLGNLANGTFTGDFDVTGSIKVSGTTVVNDSRELQNIASLDTTTATNIISGIVSGTNVSGNTVKGDGSGGLYFAGEQIGTDSEYTSGSGTYTVPSGATYILVTVTGGGAGGGGANATSSGWFHSGGGGAGGTIQGSYAVTAGDSISYSVGAGGSGGVGKNNGSAGGNSTLSEGATVFATANGGGANSQSTGGTGGGSSHSGMVDVTQTAGGNATNGGSVQTFRGGDGGTSYYGVGGTGGYIANGGSALPSHRGAGGGGAGTNGASDKTGGAGQGGKIVIAAYTGQP